MCITSLEAYDVQGPDLEAVSIEYDKRCSELFAYWNHQLESDPNVALCKDL